MKYLRTLILSIILILAVLMPAQALQTEPAYNNLDSPVDLLSSYYDAIRHHDYRTAYSYWESAPNSYTAFVNGFADTTAIQLIVQPPTRIGVAAGSAYAQIPSVIIAEHADGTQRTFAGCFVTRKTNIQSPDMPEDVWHLYGGDIKAVSNTTSIPALLASACEEA